MFSVGGGEYSLSGVAEGILTLSEVLGILYNCPGWRWHWRGHTTIAEGVNSHWVCWGTL